MKGMLVGSSEYTTKQQKTSITFQDVEDTEVLIFNKAILPMFIKVYKWIMF